MKNMPHLSATKQIVWAIALGAVLGLVAPQLAAQLRPLGEAFIAIVRVLVGPVIFFSMTSGIAAMRDLRQLRWTGCAAFFFFECMALLALGFGMAGAILLAPGAGMTLSGGPAALPESALSSSLVTVFLRNTTMHLLLAGLICGIGLVWAGAKARRLLQFVERGNILMGKLVKLVLLLAPVATFCAIAVTVSSTGMSALSPLLQLLGTIYLSSFAFVAVVLGAVAWCCGYQVWRFVHFLRDELMIVIGTSSSITALPRLVEKLEQLGCAPQLVRATMSAGFCVNLNGSNIYLMAALLFLAQAARIELDAGQYLFILAAAMITSKGACGVAGSSFLALGATMVVLPGVPASGLLAVFAIERLLKCRSLTNFLGNGVACIALCTWMKQIDRATLVGALAPRQAAKDARRPHT